MTELVVRSVDGLPEIRPGDELAALIAERAELQDHDVVVVTQKVVSKAENRLVDVGAGDPLAHKAVVERESVRILRRRGDLIISETSHGFVCANAGIDLSNMDEGVAALLPVDPDRSARRVLDGLVARTGLQLAVIVSDTFGRPWRRGLVDVAIGAAGLRPILDLRGTTDATGRPLDVTEIAIVDELAAAAELVMGKAANTPVALIRGLSSSLFGAGTVQADIVRPPSEDLFR
jgi:coenzyme F420-0:L-glutamate ligase / coenzyme F420-1:gamma-L-glutamate ligase